MHTCASPSRCNGQNGCEQSRQVLKKRVVGVKSDGFSASQRWQYASAVVESGAEMVMVGCEMDVLCCEAMVINCMGFGRWNAAGMMELDYICLLTACALLKTCLSPTSAVQMALKPSE